MNTSRKGKNGHRGRKEREDVGGNVLVKVKKGRKKSKYKDRCRKKKNGKGGR